MAETPEFEFTLPAGVMGALEEAARQFQGASADDSVASVRVAQAFALAAPVLADISAALAQIEDVYLRHELSHQATQLLDLVSSGNVSGIGSIAAQASRLVQQAMQQNGLAQSRFPTKEEKLEQLWGRIERLNEEVDDTIAYFKGEGYTVDKEEEEKLRKNKERMEEIKANDPNWKTNEEYLRLARENNAIQKIIYTDIAQQMNERGGGTEQQESKLKELEHSLDGLDADFGQLVKSLDSPTANIGSESQPKVAISSATPSENLGALPTPFTAPKPPSVDKDQWLGV